MQSKDSSTPISDESVHMQLLQRALKKTTGKCVSSFKFSLFRRQLEPIYKKAPKTLEKLHEGAVSELASNIEEELSVMFEEENIEEFMAKLDEMKAQADEITEDITAWRPSGDPAEDISAHTQPIYRQHLQQLQKVFDQLQSQNTLLQRNLNKQHAKLTQSRSAMIEHLDTWRKANCLTAEDRQEVEEFVKNL